MWNYDGSSTGQAPGDDSEVYLVPRWGLACRLSVNACKLKVFFVQRGNPAWHAIVWGLFPLRCMLSPLLYAPCHSLSDLSRWTVCIRTTCVALAVLDMEVGGTKR